MENRENFLDTFNDLTFEPETKREKCLRCRRPATVCLCNHIPAQPLGVKKTTVHILQHPNEESRPLNTVSIMAACLAPSALKIYKSKRFSQRAFPELHDTLMEKNCFLLYPCQDACNLSDIGEFEHYNIIMLDGTWKQASSIYTQNPFLKDVKKVKLCSSSISEYVIRTQPNDASFSTLECAAIALEHTEQNSEIKEGLLRPLRALCQIQLDHGAVVHQSKEAVSKTGI